MDAFIKALIEDIKYQIEYFSVKKIQTVYIGGGTPSVLGPKISVLLDALKQLPGFSPDEFTIEANPESAGEEFLSLCRQGGINRLSLGIQTFHEPSRLAVNRSADAKILQERLALASYYFPHALSADLITGLPYQDEKIVLQDIKTLLSFAPVHVSLYSLSVEAGTPMEEKIKNKTAALPDCDKADCLWLSGRMAFLNEGFLHYEVSNFAKPGKHCRHNMRYWQMQSWLGAGPSASGTVFQDGLAKRFTYTPDIDAYIKKPLIHTAVFEGLDRAALVRESLLMGFRCKEGPDPFLFRKRFGCGIEDCIPQTLARWKGKDKMLFLNAFLSQAFLELDQRMGG